MVDENKKEEIKKPEIAVPEQGPPMGEKPETRPESSGTEVAEIESIKKLLEDEVDKMDADPELKKQAQAEAIQIATLGVDDLLFRFEQIAGTKGLVAAFSAAKKTNSAFVLDRFHDFMKNGRYKNFSL